MKKVLILASVASMIDQFNMQNIGILKKQGYEVHVAANFEHGSSSSDERVNQFKKELKELNVQYYQIDFSRNITNIHQNIKAYNQIKKIMIENNFNFVHCHSPIGGVCGRLAAKVTKTKVIYTAHGFHFFENSPKINWIIYYPIEKVLSYITDILITINRHDYELANKRMKAKRTLYVPGVGVDVDRIYKINVNRKEKLKELNIPRDAIILLSVGEINKNKNHEVIIRALSQIKDKKIHYCIAGKGILEKQLNELAFNLGLEENVHLLGFRTDILELYKISDIFCFPSYREGLSVALMEAISSGLPIVCSNIRGNIDLVKEGKNGYLFNPDSYDECAEKIKLLLENKDNLNYFSENNKKFIKNFDIKIINKKMQDIYLSMKGN